MENPFYVYAHLNPGTKRVFYVGKGVGARAYTHKGRNDLWHKYINNLDDDHKVIILKEGLSEQQALTLEEKLIAKLGIVAYGGSLVNVKGPMGGFLRDLSFEKLFSEEHENQFRGYSDAEVVSELLDFSNWDYARELEREFQKIFDSFHHDYDQLKQSATAQHFWETEDLLDQIKYEFLFNFKYNATTAEEFYEGLTFIESDVLTLLNSDGIAKELKTYISKTHVWISRILDFPSSLLAQK